MRREMRSWSVLSARTRPSRTWRGCSTAMLQGWINYYGRFYKSMLYPVFRHLNEHAREVGHAEIQALAPPPDQGAQVPR